MDSLDLEAVDVDDDWLAAGGSAVRLAERRAVREVDVEQVDLPIARDELAAWAVDGARVVRPPSILAPLREASGYERERQSLRERRQLPLDGSRGIATRRSAVRRCFCSLRTP